MHTLDGIERLSTGRWREAPFRLKRGHNGIRRKTRIGNWVRHAYEFVARDIYRHPDMPEQRAIVAGTNGYRFIHPVWLV